MVGSRLRHRFCMVLCKVRRLHGIVRMSHHAKSRGFGNFAISFGAPPMKNPKREGESGNTRPNCGIRGCTCSRWNTAEITTAQVEADQESRSPSRGARARTKWPTAPVSAPCPSRHQGSLLSCGSFPTDPTSLIAPSSRRSFKVRPRRGHGVPSDTRQSPSHEGICVRKFGDFLPRKMVAVGHS